MGPATGLGGRIRGETVEDPFEAVGKKLAVETLYNVSNYVVVVGVEGIEIIYDWLGEGRGGQAVAERSRARG